MPSQLLAVVAAGEREQVRLLCMVAASREVILSARRVRRSVLMAASREVILSARRVRRSVPRT